MITQRQDIIKQTNYIKSIVSSKESHIYEVLHGMNIPILHIVREIQKLDMHNDEAVIILNSSSDNRSSNSIPTYGKLLVLHFAASYLETESDPNIVYKSTIIQLISLMTINMIKSIKLMLNQTFVRLRFALMTQNSHINNRRAVHKEKV